MTNAHTRVSLCGPIVSLSEHGVSLCGPGDVFRPRVGRKMASEKVYIEDDTMKTKMRQSMINKGTRGL